MKTVEVNIYGRTCHLRLTSAALYDIYERFGKDKSVFDHVAGTDKEAFDALCWYFAKLSEQGELSRRAQGHEPKEIITAGEVKLLLTPADLPKVKLAVIRSLQEGFGREVEDTEPIDIGLLELQKKTAAAEPAHSSSRPRCDFWGFLCGKHIC